eukprot:CAMPEP_0172391864 /NCGR_PEP_ID=MMETSP1061-20121228/8164_1 /TAXON_ID=37318 /ORGANISM="Pseudo-nitzschia pungens, Strain cf. pungens" /LENGTH=1022 /DNA_ID=CAMNT_0013122585 /DNA_START=143 /DNA_END=3211 /DNA_ORIENTATION=-
MNALTLLVDAANAESSASEPQGRGMNNKTLSNTIATNQQTEDGGAVRKGILGAAGTENGKNHSALMAAVTSTSMVAAMAAAREQAMLQQLQQQQQEQRDQFAKERFRAAANAQRMLQRELEHREMEQKQQQQQHQHHAATAAAALQQATLLRLMSGGGGIVRTSSPQLHGTALSSAASAMSGIANHGHPRQDAEYLQQLRLEALVQQRRQDTFAKLALAQELAGGAAPSATPAAASSSQSNGNGNTAGNGVATASSLMTEASKQTAAAKYQRQDAALQKAILMARADEELRNRHQQQHHHHQQQQQQERRMLQEQQKEREQQQQEDEQRLRQAVLLKLAASSTAATSNANANTAAVLNALRNVAAAAAATHAEAPTSAAGRNQRGVEESVMLKFLEEREKQRLLQLAHSQQSFAPRAVPSSVLSSSPPPAPLSSSSSSLALQQQLQQQIIAQHQQQGNKNVSGSERTDLIGSVFAKVAAAAAANRDPSILREVSGSSSSSAPAPSSDPPTATRSMVFSAIAAAEEQEKQQKQILHLTQQQQEQQGQRQRHVMDTLSHHQQQLQQHAGLARQQAAVVAHSQRDPVANGNVMEPQQPKSKQLPQSQPSVEQDASFHDSQSMILPCRARGMPMDHNIKTAYFVIPENIKHGTELLCSYFACRNAGIKFRYCVHCKLPVAKRNFAKRHRHSGSKIIAESDDLVPKETASSNNSNGMQTDSGGDDDHTMSSEQGSHQQNQKPEQEEEKGNEEHITKDQKPAETVSMLGVSLSSEKIGSPPTTIVTSCNKISGTGDESGSNYNCCQVESLTAAPLVKSNDSLKDILVCSTPSSNKHGEKEDQKEQEPSEPSLSESIPTQLTITTTERQKAWGDLLSKRPRSEQHNSNAMLQWIQEVLRVSDLENTIEGNDDPEANKSAFEKDSIINKQEKSTVNPKSLTTESCRKRLLPPKKSKMKLLLSRKEDEEMNASETNGTNIRHHGTRGPGDNEDSEDVMGKTATYEDDFPDDASTSSEDSVDLRVRKKGRSK